MKKKGEVERKNREKMVGGWNQKNKIKKKKKKPPPGLGHQWLGTCVSNSLGLRSLVAWQVGAKEW